MESVMCCVDRRGPPSSLRDDVRERLSSGGGFHSTDRAAALKSALWIPHQTITVGFLHDRRHMKEPCDVATIEKRIQGIASEWTQHANLHFQFVDGPSTIRISFDPGGSWSYIGRQCLEIPTTQATMNFGWLSQDLADRDFRRVVLHEFGHALGCIHEHQHPASGIRWKKSAVYQYYKGPPNYWSEQEVETNVCSTYAANLTQHAAVDHQSIMMYPVPAQHTEDGYSVGWNDELSELDKSFIRALY
jgi:serralysin